MVIERKKRIKEKKNKLDGFNGGKKNKYGWVRIQMKSNGNVEVRVWEWLEKIQYKKKS